MVCREETVRNRNNSINSQQTGALFIRFIGVRRLRYIFVPNRSALHAVHVEI